MKEKATLTLQKKEMAFEWFDMSAGERLGTGLITRANLRKKLDIGLVTLRKWEKEYLAQCLGNRLEKEEKAEGGYDSVEWLKSRSSEVDRSLLTAVKRGNAQAIKIYKQLTGELIEKQEVRIGLTGDEIARRILAAQRELRESGYGVVEVPSKSSLLHGKLRLGSGQNKARNRKMATLATSSQAD